MAELRSLPIYATFRKEEDGVTVTYGSLTHGRIAEIRLYREEAVEMLEAFARSLDRVVLQE